MTFSQKFSAFVCEGDSITCEVGKFTARATIYRDDCTDTPEERQDGYWPSLDPDNAGYIGPKSKSTLARHTAKAQAVLDAWNRDEWFYCGVAVTIMLDGIPLTGRYDHALWGIECNYPGSDNDYLRVVANEHLDEALEAARAKLAKLCACEDA